MSVSDIAPRPLEKDQDPISKLHNEKQVDEQPTEPGKKSAQLDHLQIGDGFVSTDRSHAPFVPIIELLARVSLGKGKNISSCLFTGLHREWGNPRQRLPALVRKIGDVTNGKDLGMTRNA